MGTMKGDRTGMGTGDGDGGTGTGMGTGMRGRERRDQRVRMGTMMGVGTGIRGGDKRFGDRDGESRTRRGWKRVRKQEMGRRMGTGTGGGEWETGQGWGSG